MNVFLNFTSFRRIIRPLSLYSEKTRSNDLDGKVKWVINEGIQILGYQQPYYQTRLTEVRLDKKSVSELSDDCLAFRTEVPTIRGLGTATGGGEIVIEVEQGRDYLTIRTDDFRYNIKKSSGTRDLHIKKYYIPINKIKLTGSISKNKLQNYVYHAPGGPLRLKMDTDMVQFVSKTDNEKASLDITNHVTNHSNNENEYLYDIRLLFDTLKKFPRNKQIELFVNEDLIKLQYEIEKNLGYINYYQQGKVDTSRTG